MLLPGRSYPLGASWDGAGTNFAVFSAHADAVELCLFESSGDVESRRMSLPERSGDVWHGYLPGSAPGLRYGFRAHGAWRPEAGLRFDASKLLVDPYARALSGMVRWDESLVVRRGGGPDTAPFVPRSIVVDPTFDWRDDQRPRTPWSRSVLYECHVKGMTCLHPRVDPTRRGRYLGLAEPVVIEHLLALGVTALSLLPIQASAVDAHLGRLGLSNYWGYGTLGFFAPDARFASGDDGAQVDEFKTMVRALHDAGLEVILDVVYNHTPETDPRGATLSFRGLDDASYYRQHPDHPGRYWDFTGCGNTLDTSQPRTLQLVVDSLRYWVDEMHVDGFRFDLAPAVARDAAGNMTEHSRFFEIVAQDPVLAGTKLIAEPWDLGPHPDKQGAFPYGFAEWNGRARDTLRRYWRGDTGQRGALAHCLSGSQDLFAWNGRGPQASVNFVTCHDGFTLEDLVSYAHKHNQANGEQNRDGRDHESSCNWGVEGATRDANVLRLRARAKRNLVASLAFSLGVPMLSQGDELGRTQQGNNNAYCHDSELNWVHWDLDSDQQQFLDFVRGVFALRRDLAVFRRRRFFHGELLPSGSRDVTWLEPDGSVVAGDRWSTAELAFGALVPGDAADPVDENGVAQRGVGVLLLLNGSAASVEFALPKLDAAGHWELLVDTSEGPSGRGTETVRTVGAHSLVLLAARSQAESGVRAT